MFSYTLFEFRLIFTAIKSAANQRSLSMAVYLVTLQVFSDLRFIRTTWRDAFVRGCSFRMFHQYVYLEVLRWNCAMRTVVALVRTPNFGINAVNSLMSLHSFWTPTCVVTSRKFAIMSRNWRWLCHSEVNWKLCNKFWLGFWKNCLAKGTLMWR